MKKANSTSSTADSSPTTNLIRGVNIGGWLVLERYIAPYQFAINECHLNGDFCWYNGSLSAPPNAKKCSEECTKRPVLIKNVYNSSDYPLDEWHLGQAFGDRKHLGEEWFNYHFEHFVTYDDLKEAKEAGITHVRVPLPHWILGDVDVDEPWIVGKRWHYFRRLVGWCRRLGLQVWPNIHTAPGSQNGFDNSGLQGTVKTCGGWDDDPKHIPRSLQVIDSVTKQFVSESMDDVVTGFGLLNEPFTDCNFTKYKEFLDGGLEIVRRNMGEDVSVFVSDLFSAPRFNDGEWWLNSETYRNTFLDSHYYNLFDIPDRQLGPKEHVESVCKSKAGHNVQDCCWEDAPATNSTLSQGGGVGRIVAEWSAAYDAMPGDLLKVILQKIRTSGVAALQDRQLTKEERDFSRHFVEAQIVSYEQQDVPGLGHGWFYWTLKMEGGAFIEWDFLRGVREGWFPKIQPANVYSESVYGSCEEILERTEDDWSIIHPYPESGNDTYWDPDGLSYQFDSSANLELQDTGMDKDDDGIMVSVDLPEDHSVLKLFAVIGIVIAFCFWHCNRRSTRHRKQYTEIGDDEPLRDSITLKV